ncbi:MAG: hypothetical protein ACTSYD_07230 [Candidatus Heimdallarchaeaceae archaeon]
MQKKFLVPIISLLILSAITIETSINAYKSDLNLIVPSVVKSHVWQEIINDTGTFTKESYNFTEYSVEKQWYDTQLDKTVFLISFLDELKEHYTFSLKELLLSNGSYISPPVYNRMQISKDGTTTDVLFTFDYNNIHDKLGKLFRDEATIYYNNQPYKVSEINETHFLWKYVKGWYNATIKISPYESLFAIPPNLAINEEISSDNAIPLPNGTEYFQRGYVKDYTTIQVGSENIEVIHVYFPAKNIEIDGSILPLPSMDIYYHKSSGLRLKGVITSDLSSIGINNKIITTSEPYYIKIGNELYSEDTNKTYKITFPLLNNLLLVNITVTAYLTSKYLKKKKRKN